MAFLARVILDSPLKIGKLRAKAKLRMHQNSVPTVLLVKLPCRVTQKHNRELKALGFVYAHYLHGRT